MRQIGTILITISILSTIFIYAPLLSSFFRPPPTNAQLQSNTNYIYIPKIKAFSEIIFDVDPWDKNIYTKALSKGVAHALNTSKPGDEGTTYLFAHSSANPWQTTRQNTAFLRLNELDLGDEIFISYESKKFHYKIKDKLIVKNSNTQFLTNTKPNQLILQTCTPPGTDWNRLLVIAEPTN